MRWGTAHTAGQIVNFLPSLVIAPVKRVGGALFLKQHLKVPIFQEYLETKFLIFFPDETGQKQKGEK